MQKLDLPTPDEYETQHSARLTEVIGDAIQNAGGWIGFDEYMQLALYAPGLGYYAAGRQKFGAQGDFITSPEISSLFAQSLARPVARSMQQLDQANIIEFGAGSGSLALELLRTLEQQQALPETYLIVELSAELQQRQYECLKAEPQLLDRVKWLQQLPEQAIDAVVIANEVLDAMPVKRFRVCHEYIEELGVTIENGQLEIKPHAAEQALAQQITSLGVPIDQDEYISEINLFVSPWLKSLAQATEKCAVYLIDYGYPRQEYYAMERRMGTLLGYYRHRALDDPLWYPGIQDLTAFVDFTGVAEGAQRHGFDVDGFTSQGNFLLNCGITELIAEPNETGTIDYLQQAQQLKTLSLPGEMGERFKVMGLSKGLQQNIPGFEQRDMRYRL